LADATLESLALFNDPSAWDKVLTGVPVIEPCSFRVKDKDGKDRVERIDMARLGCICANMQRDWLERGVPVRFLDGHTKLPTPQQPQVPQSEQPKVLAFGINPRIGKYGPQGLPAILVDEYVRPGAGAKVADLPGRSAELFLAENRVPAVALLSTEPERPMGVVFFQSREGCVFLETTKMGEAVTDPTKPPVADVDPEYERQFLKCMAKHVKRFSADDDGDEFGKAMGKHFTADRVRQLMAEALGPTNGATPEPVKKPEEKKPEATQMGVQTPPVPQTVQPDTATLARLQKLEADNAKIAADNTRLERELRYGHELSELIRAGRSFDYGKELTFCVTLNPEQFGHYKTRLAMEGAPTGGVPGTTTRPPADDPHAKAVALVRAEGITYEQARSKLGAPLS
jgi:hypothetical protein